MLRRSLRLLVVAVLALLGLLFVVVGLAAAAVPHQPQAGPEQVGPMRRIISPTRGINSSIVLQGDGVSLSVGGHGECEAGHFTVRVVVTQDSTGARALGETSGDCPAETWSLTAVTTGQKRFTTGSALVCATAIDYPPGEGAIVQRWCKEVTIVSGS